MYIYLSFFKIGFQFSSIKQAFPVSFPMIIMGHHTAVPMNIKYNNVSKVSHNTLSNV